jgi:glutaredoxin-related protein
VVIGAQNYNIVFVDVTSNSSSKRVLLIDLHSISHIYVDKYPIYNLNGYCQNSMNKHGILPRKQFLKLFNKKIVCGDMEFSLSDLLFNFRGVPDETIIINSDSLNKEKIILFMAFSYVFNHCRVPESLIDLYVVPEKSRIKPWNILLYSKARTELGTINTSDYFETIKQLYLLLSRPIDPITVANTRGGKIYHVLCNRYFKQYSTLIDHDDVVANIIF